MAPPRRARRWPLRRIIPNKADRLQHAQAVALIESWLRFPVQELTLPILQAALAAKERYQLSYWDAAIVETARALGCRELYSEDFAAGREYGGIRIVNPLV